MDIPEIIFQAVKFQVQGLLQSVMRGELQAVVEREKELQQSKNAKIRIAHKM